MKRSKLATWNFERQYKSSWKHETNFNKTLNHTMENLISKYMSGVHFTLAVRLAMQVHSGTTYVCYLWWHTHTFNWMQSRWGDNERDREGEPLLWCENQDTFYLAISNLATAVDAQRIPIWTLTYETMKTAPIARYMVDAVAKIVQQNSRKNL